ncbi:MAG TPA: OmpH family outer membrane protein [Vicinamibacterales bacterium]|nr:OmpH family outer membrane protein [Vicinamibacterales bacterium]
MRVFAVVLALGVLTAAARPLAQAPAPPPAPGTQKPAAPGTQKPATPTPRPQTQTPAPPAQPAEVKLPPPFQDGFKYGYINIQTVASQSADGKKATAEINALQQKLQTQIMDKQKALQDAQQKLEGSGSLLNDSAKQSLQLEIERNQRDLQRMAEDAQQEVERLTQRLQQEFMIKLNPVIDRIAKEKKVDMIFNAGESGLVWAAPGMEMTTDIIRALDGGGAKPAAAAPAPAAPAAPAPAPTEAAPPGK